MSGLDYFAFKRKNDGSVDYRSITALKGLRINWNTMPDTNERKPLLSEQDVYAMWREFQASFPHLHSDVTGEAWNRGVSAVQLHLQALITSGELMVVKTAGIKIVRRSWATVDGPLQESDFPVCTNCEGHYDRRPQGIGYCDVIFCPGCGAKIVE